MDPGLLLCSEEFHTLAEYKALHEQLLRGMQELGQREERTLPSTEDAFLDEVKEAHRTLFRHALPAIGGRFRHAWEPMYFGGSGRHARQGFQSDRIEEGLRGVYRWSVATNTGWACETRCAAFLTSFFRVHPFVDGNGRVGRFYVSLMCRAEGKVIPKWDDNEDSRRAYLAALEYAHETYDHPRGGLEPSLSRLADWLRPQLADLPPPGGEWSTV